MDGISRRQLITGVGAFVVGAMVTNLRDLIPTVEAKEGGKWPYEKIDPAKAGELAYQAWFDVFCAQATATGVMTLLGEKIGEPWKSFPISSLKFGMGGMLGWGLTCGSLVTGSLIIGLAAPTNLVNPMILDLVEWYTETSLPSYMPKNPRANKENIVKTVSNSPLCHISVGKWMKAANHAFADLERKDRCARVAASVAYRTAEILNAWKDGKYKERDTWNGPGTVGIPAQQNCMECHGSNMPEAPKPKAKK